MEAKPDAAATDDGDEPRQETMSGSGRERDRLLPILVIMAILMGGTVVPASLLVDEKQKRTMRALTTTSASLGEVFAAKGVLGRFLCMLMALITLLLNRAWGPQPALLLVSLALGAVRAACIGVLGGAFIKDTNMLMTVVKGGGILLYAPSLIYMFPGIPQRIARIFPTYYLIQPVIEITQQGAPWRVSRPSWRSWPS